MSRTRVCGLAAATASTNARVKVAIPERWQRKLSAVRSAVSIEARGPSTTAISSPADTRLASGNDQSTDTAGSVRANVSIAHRLPAITPSRRATKAKRPRADPGTSDAERSPRGSTSSSRARRTASCTAWIGGSTIAMNKPPLPFRTRVGELEPRVSAPGLLAQLR